MDEILHKTFLLTKVICPKTHANDNTTNKYYMQLAYITQRIEKCSSLAT